MLCLIPQSTAMLHAGGMLSADGRSKTLDASADGYVRGEACRVVFMQPSALPAAAGLGQPRGHVLASAVNTNGRASGLTAPHGPTQQALITAALQAGQP
jgi:acyl transferase domain-containing protein